MKLIPSGEYRKVYVPVLVDSNNEEVVAGEDFNTSEEAEKFGVVMANEYLEETGDLGFIRIETRLISCYIMEKE